MKLNFWPGTSEFVRKVPGNCYGKSRKISCWALMHGTKRPMMLANKLAWPNRSYVTSNTFESIYTMDEHSRKLPGSYQEILRKSQDRPHLPHSSFPQVLHTVCPSLTPAPSSSFSSPPILSRSAPLAPGGLGRGQGLARPPSRPIQQVCLSISQHTKSPTHPHLHTTHHTAIVRQTEATLSAFHPCPCQYPSPYKAL